MNGKENIINKILSDADEKSREIISAAEKQAQTLADEVQAFIAEEESALAKKVSVMSKEKAANRLSNAQLDARKYVLRQKQKLIASCYDKAYEQIVKFNDSDKKAFLSKLIERYAEEGETVYACKSDKDVVTQGFLDGFGKNLILSKAYLDADGGIVLEGAGYDKDLTLSRVMAYVREQTEAQVSATLFGEDDER